jgi:hypothetical protein
VWGLTDNGRAPRSSPPDDLITIEQTPKAGRPKGRGWEKLLHRLGWGKSATDLRCATWRTVHSLVENESHSRARIDECPPAKLLLPKCDPATRRAADSGPSGPHTASQWGALPLPHAPGPRAHPVRATCAGAPSWRRATAAAPAYHPTATCGIAFLQSINSRARGGAASEPPTRADPPPATPIPLNEAPSCVLSQPELEGNRIVLNATKQAPAPQASNILGRASQPKEAWK